MKLKVKFDRVNYLFLLKVGFGSAVSILIASWMKLSFSPSAGIITLLTIQNTKKETVMIAAKRILSFILANIIAFLIFTWIGYTAIAFGGFIILFVAFSTFLGLQDGISMNSVLMTHYLIEERIDFPLIWNEIGLLMIGMLIGISLNLIMPKYTEQIRKEQKELEDSMKSLLVQMGIALKQKGACLVQDHMDRSCLNKDQTTHELTVDFKPINRLLDQLLKKAYMESGNRLFTDTKYMVAYLEMRKLQINVLEDIQVKIEQIPVILHQSYPIAEFINSISKSFHELNNVKELLDELNQLYEYFKNDQLPKSREEFEYRAILYQILKELEYFLLIKRNFILELEDKNMNKYWNSNI